MWKHRFRRFPAYWRSYAHALSTCESGNRRHTPGPFLSFFQWTWRTWFAQGGSGHPEHATWHEQAFRAIRLTQRVGIHATAGFPNCPKGAW